MTKFIKVEDRLPEDGFCHCLFYSESEDMFTVGGVYNGVIQSNDEELYHNNITHWMPLPEPPKEETRLKGRDYEKNT